MATAISDVYICNLALTYLSTARIQSLTENTEEARKCQAVYEAERDSMLESANWNFARKEASLAQTTASPGLTDRWSNIFQLPSDCLRVCRITGDYEFEIFGDKLYTNESSIKCEYIARIEDPTLFSRSFVKALASRIASVLAYGITQNGTLAQQAEAIAERDLRNAKAVDAQEGKINKVLSGGLLEYR